MNPTSNSDTTTTSIAQQIAALTAVLGTQGVQLGKLAIIAPGPVDVVTPNLAVLVTTKAVLINRGKRPRFVVATSVNPLTTAHSTAPQSLNGATWGPVTLAPGAMALLPGPAANLAWFVVDVSQRQLKDLAWAGWITTGFALFGAGAGVYFTVEAIQRHRRERADRHRSRRRRDE